MLKIVAGIAFLLVIGFAGYRRTFTRLPLGPRLVFLTGTEYILVGFVLGEQVIGLLDAATIRSLTPLFGLGLGMIGLIFGIQLEPSNLRRFPHSFLRMTVVQAVVTMGVVFVPVFFVLSRLFGGDPGVAIAALVLAATSACTAQSALVLLGREGRARGSRLLELLRYISSLDAAVGLFLFGFAFCLMHTTPALGLDLAAGLQWFVVSLAIGIATGFLLHLLTRVRCGEEELIIFVTGMVLFSGGLAAWLRLSPLFVNLVMGITAAHLPGSKARVLNLLTRLEKPFYVVFLILAGAIWIPGSAWAVALAALYFALRLAGKLAGGYAASRIGSEGERVPGSLGLGLVSQGGVVIAMVMSFYQVSDARPVAVCVTAVLLAVIASELIGPALAGRLLDRAAEEQE